MSLYLLVVLTLWEGAGVTCGRAFLVDKNPTVSPDCIIFSLTPLLQALLDVLFSHSVMSRSLWPHRLQHARLHSLLEFAQTHVHWVDDAIQPSCPLSWTSATCPSGMDPHPPPCCRITLFPGGFHNQSSSSIIWVSEFYHCLTVFGKTLSWDNGLACKTEFTSNPLCVRCCILLLLITSYVLP